MLCCTAIVAGAFCLFICWLVGLHRKLQGMKVNVDDARPGNSGSEDHGTVLHVNSSFAFSLSFFFRHDQLATVVGC